MNQLLSEKLNDLRAICVKHQVKQLFAFGSVCTDNFQETSDIDLLVFFKDISIKDYTNNYFIIHELFENLFKRRVDLITNNSLSNPYFIQSIENTKTLLYGT